jgi:hypothetical protein
MYQALKDFAGPVAVVIASVTAASITWFIGRRQLRLVKQQADTALDQLHYNLFEKQYAIYKCAGDLIKLIANEAGKDEFRAFEVTPYYVTLEEAPFFFPKDICDFLSVLQADCQRILEMQAERRSSGPDNPKWGLQGDQIVSETSKLSNLYRAMPSRFREVLQFRQLTQPTR